MADLKERAAILTEASLILAAVFWGTNFAATKFAALSIPPLLLVALRFCGGGLVMYGVLRLLESQSSLARKDLLPMAALGCLGVAVAQTGFTFGLSMTSAANTGLIFSTAPVWGMLLGSVLGQERPAPRGILRYALHPRGRLLRGVGDREHEHDREPVGPPGGGVRGGLLRALHAAPGAPHAAGGRDLPDPLRGPVRAAPVFPAARGPWVGGVGVGTWAAVGYSAVFATAFAFVGWQRGISRIGANWTLVYQYLITAVGVASGVVFFGEVLGIEKLVGGAVILLGVYLARRQ